VSLSAEMVVSWRHLPEVQPAITVEELLECEDIVRASPEVARALAERGVTSTADVAVDPWSAGHYGDGEGGRRLRAVLCVRLGAPGDNHYAHPVENLVVHVDPNAGRVIGVEDHGAVPVPQRPANYSPDAVGPLRADLAPIEIRQPAGVSFTVQGHEVRWQKWRFRVGFTPREGLVLHTVGYEDGGRVRPILHRAALSEMVVPYGDPAPAHRHKNAFDVGEHNLGTLTNSLELGCDCLGAIHYFDAVMADGDGNPVTIVNAVCLHEEDYGLLWKHTDLATGRTEVRRSRRLVVSFVTTVGNYDYGFFWYLYQDGTIEHEVKLTGIVATGAVLPGTTPTHGQLLDAGGLYAPVHQHLFNVRLDLDVDGESNSVYEVNAVADPPGPDNPLNSAFRTRSTLLPGEAAARRTVDQLAARHWKVVNPSVRNAVGEPVGYRLVPHGNVAPLAAAGSSVRRRAGFMDGHLWVTPYRPDEMYAAGDFPNQHPGGDGLPRWTSEDRPIVETDVVVWYTFGSHHAARLEEWPVMPVQYVGFSLQPVGFFDRNPALDVPPPAPGHAEAEGPGSCRCGSNGHRADPERAEEAR
jgi:primary-amine oxidase